MNREGISSKRNSMNKDSNVEEALLFSFILDT